MAQRPDPDPERPGDDQYRWLSEPGGRRGASRPEPVGQDPEATQAISTSGPGDADDDATRAIPRSEDTRPVSEPGRGAPSDPGSDPLPPPVLPPPGSSKQRGSGDRGSGDGGTGPAGSGQRPPRPRRPRRRGRTVKRVVLTLLLVWIAFLIAVPIWAWSRIEQVDAEPDGDRPEDQPGTTYLLVGSDSREGLTEEERQELATGDVAGQRTDTILLLHSGDGPTLLLSLPRDSIVDIPGEGSDKINAAFAFGGPELLVETIESNTGIRVDGYVEIGLGGYVNIVDSLGGVEVCPDQSITDPKAGLDIEAGCQELDGPQALGYARTRDFATGDIQRVQNQREVVGAIADGAVSPWTVLNPWRYFQLAKAGSDAVRIGEEVGPIDLARFAWAMGHVTGGGLTCTVPITDLAVNWDPDLAPQLFRLVAEDRTDEISEDLCRSTGLQQ